jgi:hypothetical protein
MKQFLVFLLVVAGIAGLCYLINQNWYELSQLKLPQTNIRMPSVGN